MWASTGREQAPGESGIFLPLTGRMVYPSDDRVLRYLREGWFEFREMAFVSRLLRPGDCVVDIGSHCGLYSSIAVRRMAGRGTIVSVEPNPQLHPFILRNLPVTAVGAELSIRDQEVTLVPAAISVSTEGSVLHVGSSGDTAYATLAAASPEKMTTGLPVATRSLESLIPDRASGFIFIKLDVEGLEYSVIEASSEFLCSRRDIHMMIEFDEGNLATTGRTTSELAALLEALGYQLHSVDDLEAGLKRYMGQQSLWGANLIATRDFDALLERIRGASPDVVQETEDFFERGVAAEAIYGQSENHRKLLGAVKDLAPAVSNTTLMLTGSEKAASEAADRFLSVIAENAMPEADSAIALLQDELGRILGASRHVADRVATLQTELHHAEARLQEAAAKAAELAGFVEKIGRARWFSVVRTLRPSIGSRFDKVLGKGLELQ